METVRQQVDEILSGAAARQDWALHMLARRDISQAAMDEIVEAQTAILYGLIDAVRELAAWETLTRSRWRLGLRRADA